MIVFVRKILLSTSLGGNFSYGNNTIWDGGSTAPAKQLKPQRTQGFLGTLERLKRYKGGIIKRQMLGLCACCNRAVALFWLNWSGLDGIWMRSGCGLDVVKMQSRCSLDAVWMRSGCGLDVAWIWSECGLDAVWIPSRWGLDAIWMQSGWSLLTHWRTSLLERLVMLNIYYLLCMYCHLPFIISVTLLGFNEIKVLSNSSSLFWNFFIHIPLSMPHSNKYEINIVHTSLLCI